MARKLSKAELDAHNARMKARPIEENEPVVDVTTGEKTVTDKGETKQDNRTKESVFMDDIRDLLANKEGTANDLVRSIKGGIYDSLKVRNAIKDQLRLRIGTIKRNAKTEESTLELLEKLSDANPEEHARILGEFYVETKKFKSKTYNAKDIRKVEKPPTLIKSNVEIDKKQIETPVLFQGRTCIFSGAGGDGKSTFALQLCIAGALGMETQHDFTQTAGMKVAKLKTLIMSYEDEEFQFKDKLTNLIQRPEFNKLTDSLPPNSEPWDAMQNIQIEIVEKGAIWEINERGYDLSTNQAQEDWDDFWERVNTFNADLVIIDPSI